MMRSSLTSSARQSSVSTVPPSRRTVMESATFEISLSLWEIRIEEMPCALNWSSRLRSASLSFSFRLAVGSSRIRSFTFLESALAISTSCCLPTPRLVTSVSGDSLRPTTLSRSFVREKASDQSMTPYSAGSLPRKMFSAIDRSGTRANS
jgi:hypothetical protein